MKDAIRSRLLKAALAIAMGAAGVATYQAQQPSASVLLAMELGSHFESSGRHIGTPYVDKLMNLPDASFACGFLRVFGGHVDAVS